MIKNIIRSLFVTVAVSTAAFAGNDPAKTGAVKSESASVSTPSLKHVPQLHETAEQNASRMQWFRDAKFGIYLHWGFESDLLPADHPIMNTSFQHYAHHAISINNKPYHTGFFFKVRRRAQSVVLGAARVVPPCRVCGCVRVVRCARV